MGLILIQSIIISVGIVAALVAHAAQSRKPDAVLPDGAWSYGPLQDGRLDGEGRLI